MPFSAQVMRYVRANVPDEPASEEEAIQMARISLIPPPLLAALTLLRAPFAASARKMTDVTVHHMAGGGFAIVLLAGGDKSTQEADIARARTIAEQWERSRGSDTG